MEGELVLEDRSKEVRGTRMENFLPLAGSVVIFGYDSLGEVAGVSLEVREIADDEGRRARGAIASVKQNQYITQNAFIDADEIPELIKGIELLMSVEKNPTPFQFFEVNYKTRGNFEVVTFNNRSGVITYAVKAGRETKSQIFNLQRAHLSRLKDLLEMALRKIESLNDHSHSAGTLG